MGALLQTWRWYGPSDPVSLQDIRQAGASGIVTALHQIPHGEVWPVADIAERKRIIEAAGLRWSVVESVTVHEAIKTRNGDCGHYLENYRQTLRNLAGCGITTVCYNFMPVLDWTRTALDYELADGSRALRFDWIDLAMFDICILERKDAEAEYDKDTLARMRARFITSGKKELKLLTDNVLMGIPSERSLTIKELKNSIEVYRKIGAEQLRENLVYFLEQIMDTCETCGIKMTIHPDDPPFPILGLPRIVSRKEDLEYILNQVNREPNGICFCTGSLGAGKQNNLPDILRTVGHRVYFVHLRNVTKEEDGSFYEADHLSGDTDMYAVMKELLTIQHKRSQPIPFRPDHGHQMLDDLHKLTNPGYSAIGRLRGLAELRGLELGIQKSLFN